MKFQNRADAGCALADALAPRAKKGALVLGIPRGGVVLADIVAARLGAGFDIVIPRKMGAPGNEELAIGAVMADGTDYVNRYVMIALKVKPEYVEQEKSRQVAEIKRREAVYRRAGLPYDVKGRQVMLVDDGVATGATAIAAARWVRNQGPASLIIAAPVAPAQTVEALRHEADEVVMLASPADFSAVGEFYEDFAPVTDEHVMAIMARRGLL
ncbi:phosphoribosyltransferase [Candidatus Nitrososphaera sp. FF02]|uniref:phosphoribosyltransferase n=1 Tax=Candidatus Nitrososphaera sp. FF02 TaxID=3398226 RepID=UPI002FACE476